MKLPQIAQRFFNVPHMVTASRLAVLERFLATRFDLPLVFEPGASSIESEMAGQHDGPALMRNVSGVAVIDVHGTLVQRSGGMDAMSGLVSYSAVRGELELALADSSVRCIVLNLDSPGGEVAGCFELADRIRQATAEKPIAAYVHDLAASACYAIAAACTAIYMPETGAVGSVGVVMAHIDQSARDAAEGFKVTHLYSGARKVDGNPHEPLGEDARATMQGQIEQLAGIFQAKVAAWRGLSIGAVKATEAGIFIGAQAVAAGLADGVMSADQVLDLAMKGAPMGKPRLEGDPAKKEDEKAAAPTPPPMDDEDEEVPEEKAAALRAEGVTQERKRITGLLALVKHPHEMAQAIVAIDAGMTRGDLAEKLLDQSRAAGGRHLAAVRADVSAAGQQVATAAPPETAPGQGNALVVSKGDDTATVEQNCKAAWDRDPAIRARFGLGGYRAFVGFNKVAAKGILIDGKAVGGRSA